MEAVTSLSRTSSYDLLPPLTPPPPSAQRSQNCPQHTSAKLYWVAFVLFCIITLGMFYLYHCYSNRPSPEELSSLDKLCCAIAEAELDTEFIVGSPQDNWYCAHNPPTSPMEKEPTTSLIKKMLEEESRWSDKDSRIPQNWRAFNPFVNMIFRQDSRQCSSFLDQEGGSLLVDAEEPSDRDSQILNIINVLKKWRGEVSSDEPSPSSKLGDPIAILQVMIPECLIYYQTHSQYIQFRDKLWFDEAANKEWTQILRRKAKDRDTRCQDTRRIELVSEREVRVVWKTHLPLANGSMRVYKITQDITITPQGGSEPCSIKMCRRTERLK